MRPPGCGLAENLRAGTAAALAEFDIVTFEGAVINTGVDGVPVSQFLREFGSFTLVLEYDGLKIEQKFPADQIRKAAGFIRSSAH